MLRFWQCVQSCSLYASPLYVNFAHIISLFYTMWQRVQATRENNTYFGFMRLLNFAADY